MTSAYLSESAGCLRLSPAWLPLPPTRHARGMAQSHLTIAQTSLAPHFAPCRFLEVYPVALTITAEMPERWRNARALERCQTIHPGSILAPGQRLREGDIPPCSHPTLHSSKAPHHLPLPSSARCNAAPQGKVGAKAAASSWDPPGIAEKPGQRSGGHHGERGAGCPMCHCEPRPCRAAGGTMGTMLGFGLRWGGELHGPF